MHRIRLLVVAIVLVAFAGTALAQKARINKYHKSLSTKLSAMVQDGEKCKVNMNDSTDGDGMDAEIRLTMGIREFESFAPVAALEAAALPHKFPAVNIICGTKRRAGSDGSISATRSRSRQCTKPASARRPPRRWPTPSLGIEIDRETRASASTIRTPRRNLPSRKTSSRRNLEAASLSSVCSRHFVGAWCP